eukprot:1274310-Pleurochrysis_carterae.AAC.1
MSGKPSDTYTLNADDVGCIVSVSCATEIMHAPPICVAGLPASEERGLMLAGLDGVLFLWPISYELDDYKWHKDMDLGSCVAEYI